MQSRVWHRGRGPRRNVPLSKPGSFAAPRSVFERYNIVNECDLVEAARKLNALHTTVRLKPDTTYGEVPTDHDREHGPHRSAEGGHNLGTVTRHGKSRLGMSL